MEVKHYVYIVTYIRMTKFIFSILLPIALKYESNDFSNEDIWTFNLERYILKDDGGLFN